MTIVYTLTDNNADCGSQQACQTNPLANTTQTTEAQHDATAGSTEETVTISSSSTQAGYFIQTSGGVGETEWESGNYTVRLNFTTGHMNVTWEEVHICRVNSSCTSQETIASATNLGIVSDGGKKSTTVSGSATTAQESDDLYVVCVFTNSNNHNSRSVGITPSTDFDTPIHFHSSLTSTIGNLASSITSKFVSGTTSSQTLTQKVHPTNTRRMGPVKSLESVDSISDKRTFLASKVRQSRAGVFEESFRGVSQTDSENVSTVTGRDLNIGKRIASTLGNVESVVAGILGGLETQVLTQSMVTSDENPLVPSKSLNENSSVKEKVSLVSFVIITGLVTTEEKVSQFRSRLQGLSSVVGIEENVFSSFDKRLSNSEVLASIDSLATTKLGALKQVLTEPVSISENVSRTGTLSRVYSESLSVVESALPSGKYFSNLKETVGISVSRSFGYTKTVTGTLSGVKEVLTTKTLTALTTEKLSETLATTSEVGFVKTLSRTFSEVSSFVESQVSGLVQTAVNRYSNLQKPVPFQKNMREKIISPIWDKFDK